MSGQISDANQLAVVFNQNAGVTTTGPGYGTVPPNPYNSESYSSNVSIFRNQVFVQPVPKSLSQTLNQMVNDATLGSCTWQPSASSINKVLTQDIAAGTHDVYDSNNIIVPHLTFYKRLYLYPAQPNNNNAWTFCPPTYNSFGPQFDNSTSKSLMRNMIPWLFNDQVPDTYTPIVEYYNGSNWVSIGPQNQSGGAGWIIDYAAGMLVFYTDPTTLNNTYNLHGSAPGLTARDDNSETGRCRISFIAYTGKELDDILDSDGNLTGSAGGALTVGLYTGDISNAQIDSVSTHTATELYFPSPEMDLNYNSATQQVFVDISLNDISTKTLDPYFFDVPLAVSDPSYVPVPVTEHIASVDISWNPPPRKRTALPLGAYVSQDYADGASTTSPQPIRYLPYHRGVKLDFIEWNATNLTRPPHEREPKSSLFPDGWDNTINTSTIPGWQTFGFFDDVVGAWGPKYNSSSTSGISSTDKLYKYVQGSGGAAPSGLVDWDLIPRTVNNVRIYAAPHGSSSTGVKLPRLLNDHPANAPTSGAIDPAKYKWFETDDKLLDQAEAYQFRVAIYNDQDVSDEDAPQYKMIRDPIYTGPNASSAAASIYDAGTNGMLQYWNYQYYPDASGGEIVFANPGAPTPPTSAIFRLTSFNVVPLDIANDFSSLLVNIDNIRFPSASTLGLETQFTGDITVTPDASGTALQYRRTALYRASNVADSTLTTIDGSNNVARATVKNTTLASSNDYDFTNIINTDISFSTDVGGSNPDILKWGYYTEATYDVTGMSMGMFRNSTPTQGQHHQPTGANPTTTIYPPSASHYDVALNPALASTYYNDNISGVSGARIELGYSNTSGASDWPVTNSATSSANPFSAITPNLSTRSLRVKTGVPTRSDVGAAANRFATVGSTVLHWSTSSTGTAQPKHGDGGAFTSSQQTSVPQVYPAKYNSWTSGGRLGMTGSGPSNPDTAMSNVMFLDTTAIANTVLEYTENTSSPFFDTWIGNHGGTFVGSQIVNTPILDMHTRIITGTTLNLAPPVTTTIQGYPTGNTGPNPSAGIARFQKTTPNSSASNFMSYEVSTQEGGDPPNTNLIFNHCGYYQDLTITKLETMFRANTSGSNNIPDIKDEDYEPYEYKVQEFYYTGPSSGTLLGGSKSVDLYIAHLPPSIMSITGTTPPSTDDFYLTGTSYTVVYFQGLKMPRTDLNIETDLQVNLTDVSKWWRTSLNIAVTDLYYGAANATSSSTTGAGQIDTHNSPWVDVADLTTGADPLLGQLSFNTVPTSGTALQIKGSAVWANGGAGTLRLRRYSRNLANNTSAGSTQTQFEVKCDIAHQPGYSPTSAPTITPSSTTKEVYFGTSSAYQNLWWDWTWGNGQITVSPGSNLVVNEPTKPSGLLSVSLDSSYGIASSSSLSAPTIQLVELDVPNMLPENPGSGTTGTTNISNGYVSVSFPNSTNPVSSSDIDHTMDRSSAPSTAQTCINKSQMLWANKAFRTRWTTNSKDNPYHDYTNYYESATNDLHDYSIIGNGPSVGSGIQDKLLPYRFSYVQASSGQKWWNWQSTTSLTSGNIEATMIWIAMKVEVPAVSSSGTVTYRLVLKDANDNEIPHSKNTASSPDGYWLFHHEAARGSGFTATSYNGQIQRNNNSTPGCYQQAISSSYTTGTNTGEIKNHYFYTNDTSADTELIIYIGIPRDNPGVSGWDGSIGNVDITFFKD